MKWKPSFRSKLVLHSSWTSYFDAVLFRFSLDFLQDLRPGTASAEGQAASAASTSAAGMRRGTVKQELQRAKRSKSSESIESMDLKMI